MVVLVQCRAGSADLKEQANIYPESLAGRISCAEFGPRPVLQECVVTTTENSMKLRLWAV